MYTLRIRSQVSVMIIFEFMCVVMIICIICVYVYIRIAIDANARQYLNCISFHAHKHQHAIANTCGLCMLSTSGAWLFQKWLVARCQSLRPPARIRIVMANATGQRVS